MTQWVVLIRILSIPLDALEWKHSEITSCPISLLLNQIQRNIETDNTITVQLHIFPTFSCFIPFLCCVVTLLCVCVHLCMHVWYGELCAQQSLLISIETWHRHLCIFSPHSSICSTPTPIRSHTHTHTLTPNITPHPPSHNIPLMGVCAVGLWESVISQIISPHIPLSIKEPVCVPTAARSTPLQLFVLSDTSTCYLYLCCVYSGYIHLMHSTVRLIFFFLPYSIFLMYFCSHVIG